MGKTGLDSAGIIKSLHEGHLGYPMAGGFAKDGAVQDQIDASVADAIKRARDQLPAGDSLSSCEQCEETIPLARREAVPGVRLCIACQGKQDNRTKKADGYNRRGSKDSQLR